jgi:formate dehydrogenase iron-sulfur subunit
MTKAALVDITKCTACRGCQVACKAWNDNLGEETHNEGTYENPPELSASTWTRIEFYEFGNNGGVQWYFRKAQCMHCTNASCEAVCPSSAISHQGNVVIIDQDICIGCGYCVMACPFDAVHNEPPRGTARKCWFCMDRVGNGYEPACVKTCPPGALQFGERDELLTTAHARVNSLKSNGHPNARLYGENEMGGLQWLYIIDGRPSEFGLPESPQLATHALASQWVGGIITAGVLAAIPFWLLFRRRRELEESSRVGGE